MKLTKEDDNLIKKLYVDKKMSTTEIAKQFNVSHRTIILHLNKLGIKRRTLHESQYNYRGKIYLKSFLVMILCMIYILPNIKLWNN